MLNCCACLSGGSCCRMWCTTCGWQRLKPAYLSTLQYCAHLYLRLQIHCNRAACAIADGLCCALWHALSKPEAASPALSVWCTCRYTLCQDTCCGRLQFVRQDWECVHTHTCVFCLAGLVKWVVAYVTGVTRDDWRKQHVIHKSAHINTCTHSQ